MSTMAWLYVHMTNLEHKTIFGHHDTQHLCHDCKSFFFSEPRTFRARSKHAWLYCPPLRCPPYTIPGSLTQGQMQGRNAGIQPLEVPGRGARARRRSGSRSRRGPRPQPRPVATPKRAAGRSRGGTPRAATCRRRREGAAPRPALRSR